MGRKAGMGMLRANREARITQVEAQDTKPSRKKARIKGLRNQIQEFSFERSVGLFKLESDIVKYEFISYLCW